MIDERAPWRMRPAVLALIGLGAAGIVQQLVDQGYDGGTMLPPSALRVALAMLVATGACGLIFTLERVRIGWSLAFSAVIAVVAGLVTWWSGPRPDGEWWDWRFACLFLAVAIAAPLFQAARGAGTARFDYAEVHGNAWTNVVLGCAGLAFTGIAFALAYLLAELFGLIEIHLLRDLLRHGWANAALAGAAFGGAVGLLRERDRVVRTLQRVVTAILAVLAPVLGLGLLLFLIALPFTGLGALWDATKATTPILLSCVVGALILINAVIGDGEQAEPTNPALGWGAMALGLAILPLAVIAAVATGLRIGQYGFTPDRLWALTFVIVACAYALGYLVTLVRRRRAWADALRPANLRLAFALCGLALILATPLVSFNAISTRDQVARLEQRRVAPAQFDWAALAFDFGEPGRVALKRLTRSADAEIAKFARLSGTRTSRYDLQDVTRAVQQRQSLPSRLRVLPAAVTLPPALLERLTDYRACETQATERCTVLYSPGADDAVAFSHNCIEGLLSAVGSDLSYPNCQVARLVRSGTVWAIDGGDTVRRDRAVRRAIIDGLKAAQVEVRAVRRRQVFVGGHPIGGVFE